MKVWKRNSMLVLLLHCHLLLAGYLAHALSYDYTASIECLEDPHEPQYGGGMVENPDLNEGLKGWNAFGGADIEHRVSEIGNSFIVASNRSKPHASVSQSFYLLKDMLYSFSAWMKVSVGSATVTAVFKTGSGFEHAGVITAESGCWSMLKGGLTVPSSGPAELYFESKNTSVEVWVDSISLQPFTKEQWTSHQAQSMERIHMRKVRLHAVDKEGNPLVNATISIKQRKPTFPFGCAISKQILTNPTYQNWFTSRFTVTTFENEMKWYSTENIQGVENYSIPDAMLQFAKSRHVSVRGHNVFWDDPQYQPWWVKSLSPSQLKLAAEKRINSVVSRYKGQLIAWDVVNENLHFSFFESKLGNDASRGFYRRAHQIDRRTRMFLNEFNTIEESSDESASPGKYMEKLREIRAFSGNSGPTGIGLEAHFDQPNLPYMRAAIDTLAAAKLPIWLTELDVRSSPNQAQYLEQVLREGRAHPAVNGIVMWASWKPEGCFRMCLTDNDFNNLPTGDVVDKLINEWSHKGLVGTSDGHGFFETSLFHGDYEVTVAPPAVLTSSLVQTLRVVPADVSDKTAIYVRISP